MDTEHITLGAREVTAEQRTILEHAKAGESLRVLALAGTGKTSTLQEIAAATVGVKSLYLAFNRAIADEARRKFPDHVVVKTAHALAYAALGHRFKHRLETSTWALREALTQRFPLHRVSSNARFASTAVIETLNTFLASAAEFVAAAHVPEKVRDDVNTRALVSLTQTVFDTMADVGSDFPVTHDVYLKAFQLSKPHLPWQLIYFDEAQDANGVILALVQAQEHLQRIFVGDESQAIYGFRHAVNALESLRLPAYPLTQSWRFGSKIAHVANLILEAKDEPLRVRGRPDRDDRIASTTVPVPNVVLARTNAGLFEEAYAVIGKLEAADRIAFVGGVDPVIAMVMGAYELYSTGKTQNPDFRFFSGGWRDLRGAVESGQGGTYGPFVKLVERHEAKIPAMCDALHASAIPDRHKARVAFSTAHRFKGQEAHTVRLAGDFPPFCDFDYNERRYVFRVEEANIAYVAVTRAEHVLDISAYAPILNVSLTNRRRIRGSVAQ